MGAKIKNSKKLTSKMEDYLEAILILRKKNRVARVGGIARLMNVEKSNVTFALKVLSQNNLVIHERYGYVDLTFEGERLAEEVLRKHKMLLRFLSEVLSINPETAAKDACKMEHSISPETFKKLTKFIEFVDTCPDHDRPDWLKSFDHYFKTGKRLRCKVRQMKQETLTKA